MPSHVPPDPALAAVLRLLRQEREESQEDVAFGADIATGTVSRVERVKLDPAWTTVRSLAKALDMSLEELGAAVEREETSEGVA